MSKSIMAFTAMTMFLAAALVDQATLPSPTQVNGSGTATFNLAIPALGWT